MMIIMPVIMQLSIYFVVMRPEHRMKGTRVITYPAPTHAVHNAAYLDQKARIAIFMSICHLGKEKLSLHSL